jgi:ketosteroid isomerase-like protein
MLRLLALSVLSLTFTTHAHEGTAASAAVRRPPLPVAATEGEMAQLRREIEDANRRMVETFKRGDLAGVAAFYEDEAVIFFARDKSVRGRKAIDAYWMGLKGGKDWKLEVYEVGGDRETIYEVGRSTFTSEVDGKETVYACDILVIWKRQKDGRYKIHVDFFN